MSISSKTRRLLDNYEKILFRLQCAELFDAPRLQKTPSSATVVTMLRSKDVLIYLFAIRSLCRYCPVGEIIILDDGTLKVRDKELLADQLGDPLIIPIASVETGSCPRGGCWERLLTVIDLSSSRYVIQLDSDILLVAPVPEVCQAIETNTSFTLSGGAQEEIVSLQSAAKQVASYDLSRAQTYAELILPEVAFNLGTRYVRGSAGFAGFAAGTEGRALVEALSAAMQDRMGEKWTHWGTEQFASNFVVANSQNAQVLPWTRYQFFDGGTLSPEVALVHFIGSWRYHNGTYRRMARDMLPLLLDRSNAGYRSTR